MKLPLALCLLALLAMVPAARGGDEPPPEVEKPKPPAPAPNTITSANMPPAQPGNGNLAALKGSSGTKVMVVPLNDEETSRYGMIDPWQASFIGRRLREAKREGYGLVILEIDTGGGLVAACEKINRAIEDCGLPVIAFVRGEAFSGGALISLGCKAIAMQPGAQIGGAQAIGSKGDLPPDVREKARAYLTAMVTGLCERNNFPKALARGMVDQEVEILETDDPQHRFLTDEELEDWQNHTDRRGAVPNVLAKWKKKDTILSLTAQQAYDGNLASGIYPDRAALLAALGVPAGNVYENGIGGGEKLARFLGHPLCLVLLVIVGLIALVWELKSPGHGIGFGIFGMCFGVFFWLAIFADTAGAGELILFGLGVTLLAAEIFILPGFGVCGFAGIGMIIGSIMLAFLPEGAIPGFFRSSSEASPFDAELVNSGLMWASVALFAFIGTIFTALIFGVRAPGLNRMALKGEVQAGPLLDAQPAAAQASAYTPAYPETNAAIPKASAESPALAALVGQEGLAETDLRPGGKVRLAGVSYDATSEGGWIEDGCKVKVLSAGSNGLVVRSV